MSLYDEWKEDRKKKQNLSLYDQWKQDRGIENDIFKTYTAKDMLSEFNEKKKAFNEVSKAKAESTLNNLMGNAANILDIAKNTTQNIVDDVRQSGAEDLSSYVQRKNQEKAITNLRANPTSPLFDYGTFANEKIKQENRQNARYKSLTEAINGTQTQYGNINIKRNGINWNKDNIEQYKDRLDDLGIDTNNLEGSMSNVLGSSRTYNTKSGDIEVAYSPLLETSNGLTPLYQDEIDNYITDVLDKAEKEYKKGKYKTLKDAVIDLDKNGIGVKDTNGNEIKGLIADLGDTARQTGSEMHDNYVRLQDLEQQKIQQALNLQNNLRTEATPGQKVGYTVGDTLNNVTHGMTDTASNLLKGFLYWQGDIANAFNNKEKANLLYKIAGTKDAASQYVYEPLQEELEKYSKLDDTGRQVAQGIGQQMARVGLSAGGNILAGGMGLTEQGTRLFNDIASNTGMFAGSMASARDEAISQGATQDQARVYGYLSGLSETASESMFGGFGKLTDAMGISRGIGGLDEKLSYGLRKNISNAFARNLVNLGVSAIGEGTEEVVSGLASAIWKKLTYLPDEDLRKLIEDEKLADSFVVGMLTSAIFQIPEYTSSSLNNVDMSTKQDVKEAVQNEKINQQYKKMMDNWKKENPEAYRMFKTTEEYFDKNPILKEGSLIESAEKYGYNPNTVEIQATQRMLDKAGIKVEFNDEINDPNIEGLWTVDNNGNRSIIINPYASKETIFQKVAVHELTHDILNKDIKEAESFKKDILDLISKEKNFTEAKTKIENLYKNITENGKPIYDLTTEEGNKKFNDIVEEELITNAMAEKFGVQEEINKLVSYKPSLARRIYDKVVEFFGKATGNEKLLWKNVQNKFERAFSQEGQFKPNEDRYSTTSQTDNQGRTLTNYVVEKTKDVAPQLRDKNGNLLLMYHGSPNGEIESLRGGTYFTTNKEYAERYKNSSASALYQNKGKESNNPKIYEAYLDIKKPFDLSDPKAKEIYINDYIKGGNALGINPYMSDSEYDKIKNIDWTEVEDLKEFLQENGYDYDGIIADEGGDLDENGNVSYRGKSYIPFSEKQIIKANDNNTRYSVNLSNEIQNPNLPTTDNQGRTLTKQQQEYFKDSKVRDENGELLTVYHGTNSDFTIFDRTKGGQSNTGASVGFWFTETKEGAENFANDVWYGDNKPNAKEVYLNIKKPKIYENVENETQKQAYRQEYENLEKEARDLRKEYSWEKTDYMTTMTFDTLIRDYQTAERTNEKVDLDLFRGLAKERGFSNEQISNMERDAKKYTELIKKSKEAGNNYDKLRYSDAYEQFKIDIYEMAGQSAEDANTGGLGMSLNNPKETVEKYRNKLIEEGYDGIVIKNTRYDNSNFAGENNQYVAFYPNQIKNVDNQNPTDNPDIRYSIENDSLFGLEGEGTRTKLEQLRTLDFEDKRLPTQAKTENKTILVKENKTISQNEEIKSREPIKTIENKEEIKSIKNITEPKVDIKDGEEAKILSEPLKRENKNRRFWAILKANIIDKGAVFEKISRLTKNRELQGKWDSTLTSGAKAQIAEANARYILDPKTNKETQVSKSLESIRDEVGDNRAAFQEYMYHQLNIDRMTLADRFEGMENKPVFGKSVTADTSRDKVKQLETKYPEFKKYAQDIYDYLNENKRILVNSGVISQELSDKLDKMYPHYVPIQRIDNFKDAIAVPLDTRRTGVNAPLKSAKGGSQDIQPLFTTIQDRTLQTYKASDRNDFGLELMKSLKQLNQLNTTKEDINVDNIIEEITTENGNNELLKKGEKGRNPTFTVFENGKRVTFEINDDIYDALKPKNELLQRIDESKPAKTLRAISNFRRNLITEYNPLFMATNSIKDIQEVLFNSQHALKTYSKVPEAYAQIIKKGTWFKEYMQNGGVQNSYFTEGEFDQPKKSNSIAKKIITAPVNAISNLNEVIELAPRLAEYIASREEGRSIKTSMLDAARVTTNFKAGGDITKTLNRNGATFLNASVQGAAQVVRNFQEANAKGLKGYAVLVTKLTVAGLLPQLINGLIWDDDEDYQNLQDYIKDNYYIVGKVGDTFIRIPKGRAMATVQKIFNNAGEFTTSVGNLDGDKLASAFWKDLQEDVQIAVDNLAPNNPLENNILSPITQVISGKKWHGGDMIPTRLKDKPAVEQYDETTDSLSKFIGEKTGISPIKINYLIDQYSGGLGDVILPMLTPQAENNPIEDKFTSNAIMKNKYSGEYYDTKEQLTIKSNSEKATDLDKIKASFLNSVQSNKKINANGVTESISDLNAQKRDIQNSSLPDETKKQKLKDVQRKINTKTEWALKQLDNIKIDGDIAKLNNNLVWCKDDGKWEKIDDKTLGKINDSNISLKKYVQYKQNVTTYKKATGDTNLNTKEEIPLLQKISMSDNDRAGIYKEFVNPQDSFYQSVSVDKNFNINAYLDYKLQDFESDKDDNGKTITNSRKKKVYNYIAQSSFDYPQRLMLTARDYKLQTSEKQYLAKYITNLDISTDEMIAMFDSMGNNFTVYNGQVYFK